MNIKGLDELKNKLNECQKTLDNRKQLMEKIFHDEVDRVLADAVKKAPVDEGVLRGSAISSVQTVSNLIGKIEFGGLASQYAEVQHENEFKHPKGGQDHYLYGNADSAWTDDSRERLLKNLVDKLQKEIDKSLT